MTRISASGIPLRLIVAAAWLVSMVVVGGRLSNAHAATPTSGSISAPGTLSWDFAPVTGGATLSDVSGPVASLCPPAQCDNFDLTVNVPAAPYYQTNTATLKLYYTWNSGAVPTDLDIFAFGPSGQQSGPGTPDNFAAGAGGETLVITDPAPGVWHIRSVAADAVNQAAHVDATLTTAARPAPGAPPPNPTNMAFINYQVPPSMYHRSGEPAIGANWFTGDTMTQADLHTFRVHFNDGATPSATWTDVSPLSESQISLDPIGFQDNATHRWFTSQLADVPPGCSLTAYTDNAGGTGTFPGDWQQSSGCPQPAGVDHQTIGGGPYAPGTPFGPLTSYPNAVYYCSQDIAAALCGRSDTGGVTFNNGVVIYAINQCGGLHGHVKAGPDGTVYVPNKSCVDSTGASHPGLVVSRDNGQTWTVNTVPDGNPKSPGSDPSVGIGANNTVYYGYANNENGNGHPMIAVSHDHGKTWSKSIDVGLPFGIQNSQFPEVVAGDDNRASYAFLGTTTPGDDQSAAFTGVWHMYVATTYDGGATWTTIDATPTDPVQRGCVWNGGGSNACRNMLDFNDITIDKTGGIQIAYTDGCSSVPSSLPADPTRDCENNPNAVTANKSAPPNDPTAYGRYSAVASILHQSCGNTLFAAYDGTRTSCVTGAPGTGGTGGTDGGDNTGVGTGGTGDQQCGLNADGNNDNAGSECNDHDGDDSQDN